MLPYPLDLDPAAAMSGRFALTITPATAMAEPKLFLELVAENLAMALRAVGAFAVMVDPDAVVRSRSRDAGPRTLEVEVEFDRPRPDLLRMIVNACASHGYDLDGTALFDRLQVSARAGGPEGPAALTLPAPPPYSLTDGDGAALTVADLPRKQNYTIYAGVAGFDQRGEDLMMALSNLSESACLADPQTQPVETDFTAPIAWPAYADAEISLPPRLGISRLCGGEFAVQIIAASIAVAALTRPEALQLIAEENEY